MKKIYFADNFKILVKNQGLTVKKFAKKMGYNENTFYSYSKGQNFPHVLLLCEIAEELNVSLDDLVYRDYRNELIYR